MTEETDPTVSPTTPNFVSRISFSQAYVDARLGRLRRAHLVHSAYGEVKGWRHLYLHALTEQGRALLRALFPPPR